MKSRKVQEDRQIVFLRANTKQHKVSVLKHVANKFYVDKRDVKAEKKEHENLKNL